MSGCKLLREGEGATLCLSSAPSTFMSISDQASVCEQLRHRTQMPVVVGQSLGDAVGSAVGCLAHQLIAV